jgi:hypothetical protein
MVRGNNKTNIFSDDQDRNKFLQRLGENITEAKCSVYAWVGENFGDVVSEMDLNNLRQVEKVQLTRTSPGTLLLMATQALHAEPLDKVKFVKVSEQEGKAVIRDVDGKLSMIGVGDVIGIDGKVVQPGKRVNDKKKDSAADVLHIIEIAKDRVVLERQTADGPEKIIVRLLDGKQSVEKVTASKPKQPNVPMTQIMQVTRELK